VALGLLRRELIDTLGVGGARAVLTRFGYAHGWRTAEHLEAGLPWASADEWRQAGGRLHTLKGLVRVEAPPDAATPSGAKLLGDSVWHDSYEAEQHLLHLGRAEEPVCWTLTGFASGYLSRAYDQEVYCIEERCRGKGDAYCRLIGRPRTEWGDAITPYLAYYEQASLDATLSEVTKELKRTERRLHTRRQQTRGGERREVSGLVLESAAMGRVIDVARRVAQVDS